MAGAKSNILRYGGLAAAAGVGLAIVMGMGPDGESKNSYAEALAARADAAAAGAPFSGEGLDIDTVKPVGPHTVKFAVRLMMRQAEEDLEEPTAQGRASVTCGLAAANKIPLPPEASAAWGAARSTDRLETDNNDKQADEFYTRAGTLCLDTVVNTAAAGQIPQLAIPVGEKN